MHRRRRARNQRFQKKVLEFTFGILITLKALKLATENDIDLDQVQGSGAKGRILVKDVRKFLRGQSVEK